MFLVAVFTIPPHTTGIYSAYNMWPFPHTTRIYSAYLLILKTCASLCLGMELCLQTLRNIQPAVTKNAPFHACSATQCEERHVRRMVEDQMCLRHPQTWEMSEWSAGQNTTEISIPCDYITCLIFTEDKSSTTIVFQMTERQRHDLVTSKLAYFLMSQPWLSKRSM